MSNKLLVVDISLTGAMIGIVDNELNLISWKKFDFELNNDVTEIISNVKKNSFQLLEDNKMTLKDIKAVTVDLPGFIDHTVGMIRLMPILKIKDRNIKKDFKMIFPGKTIHVINDAFAAALGEFWVGRGIQYDSILFYTIDSVVSGAIINHDKIITGSRGFSGQFGHGANLCENNIPCLCGLKGCLSACVSELGIKKQIIELFKNNPGHPASFYFDKNDLENLDTGLIYEIYNKNGNPKEIYDLLRSILNPLIKHMTTMYTALDPEAIIFSGSVARLDKLLIKILLDGVKETISNRISESLIIEQAELGSNAAMIGSAYYALHDGIVEE